MFKRYDDELAKTLSGHSHTIDWDDVLKHHRLMLKRIYNERQIHLTVTVFTGIVMSGAFYVILATEKVYVLILGIPLLILFVGYLFHYRFLENLNQKWYETEDRIIQYKK